MSSFGLIEENIELSHIHLAVNGIKGQLISKGLFGVIIWTKIQMNFF